MHGRTRVIPSATRGADLVRACSQFLTYLDRSSLAFAAPQMLSDLRMDGTTYGLGAGLLFVTYSVLMLPGSLLVERLGAPNGLALATVAWGLVTALTSLVRDAPSFFAARLALGAAEACCFPGALLRANSSSIHPIRHHRHGNPAALPPCLMSGRPIRRRRHGNAAALPPRLVSDSAHGAVGSLMVACRGPLVACALNSIRCMQASGCTSRSSSPRRR